MLMKLTWLVCFIIRIIFSNTENFDFKVNKRSYESLTSQNQKETAGIPEYARKGNAALSKESFSLQRKQPSLLRILVLPCHTPFLITRLSRQSQAHAG